MKNSHQEPLGPEGSYFETKAREEYARNRQKLYQIYPLLVTILYLFLGFAFHLWHPGWLVFLTIPIFYMSPAATPMQKLCNPVMITLIYLILGFFFHLWHPGWIIFLLIPISELLKR